MSYKLTYFNFRGLAEPLRLMLTDNAIPFDDERISKEEWVLLKPKMPFGKIPCLMDGNERIVQTAAITRHLARKHDLNGSNESETTFIDMFFECLRDVHSKYVAVIRKNYENEKEALISETYPAEFNKLETLFKTYLNGEKYVAGEKVSYADYYLFNALDIALILSPTVLDTFPSLKAFHERFSSRPALKQFFVTRATMGYPVNDNGKQ